MIEKIKTKLQYLLPQQKLTELAGWIANKKTNLLTQFMIKIFVKIYKINMEEAKINEFSSYNSFNDFFTRELKENIRPIVSGNNQLSLPADGIVSQIGSIVDEKILQAKGHSYNLTALLAGNDVLIKQFINGLFITIYLSPRDYHRVHIPCDALLTEMIYVPGTLFSVNKSTEKNIPHLFARNERLICIFETEFGNMIQILIGATIIGSIETTWHGCINNKREGILKRWTYPKKNHTDSVFLKKGEEMGKFKLGSTVINLFESTSGIQLNPILRKGSVSRVGELLGEKKI
ncbi:MAG: archaetidylserine decarboxylase [Arsenophonus sp.]|nr:MAG: archaetidylserine decarboxylase [Arsenophonus sp.]